jgi:hypothetical protein
MLDKWVTFSKKHRGNEHIRNQTENIPDRTRQSVESTAETHDLQVLITECFSFILLTCKGFLRTIIQQILKPAVNKKYELLTQMFDSHQFQK